MQAPSIKPKFFYGWVVVGVTIAVSLLAAGICSAPGVMLVPMQVDTTWGRDTISFAVSLGIFIFGFGSPLAGWLITKFGIRLVMLLGLLIVPPTIALCADAFGKKNVGIVYGWVFCAHQVGGALASWMGGYTRVQLDSYTFAFVTAGALAMAAGIFSLRIRRGAAAQPALV